jgi:hypothetical protein
MPAPIVPQWVADEAPAEVRHRHAAADMIGT